MPMPSHPSPWPTLLLNLLFNLFMSRPSVLTLSESSFWNSGRATSLLLISSIIMYSNPQKVKKPYFVFGFLLIFSQIYLTIKSYTRDYFQKERIVSHLHLLEEKTEPPWNEQCTYILRAGKEQNWLSAPALPFNVPLLCHGVAKSRIWLSDFTSLTAHEFANYMAISFQNYQKNHEKFIPSLKHFNFSESTWNVGLIIVKFFLNMVSF